MAKVFTNRLSAGTEKIGLFEYADPVEQVAQVREEQYFHPACFLPLMNPTGSGSGVVNADFPVDATTLPGVIAAATSTSITLATGAPNWDISGMLVLITNNTTAGAIGQVRRITAYSSLVATVATWGTTPHATAGIDNYTILVDCMRFSEFHIKTEFSNNAATDPYATILTTFYDQPYANLLDTTAAEGKVNPRKFIDIPGNVDNLGFTDGATKSGFFHGRTRTISCRGSIGAKVRLYAALSGGDTVILWACAT